MKRIIWHWTAGTNKATAEDKEHYHFIIEGMARSSPETSHLKRTFALKKGRMPLTPQLQPPGLSAYRWRPWQGPWNGLSATGGSPSPKTRSTPLTRLTAPVRQVSHPVEGAVLSRRWSSRRSRSSSKGDISWMPGMTAPQIP